MPKQSLEFYLALDNSKFNKALNLAQTKVQTAGKKMAAGVGPAIDGFKKLSKGIAAVGVAGAAVGAAVGIAAINSTLKESIALAGVQENAEAKLAAVVKATGGAAGLTAAEMAKYAGELQQITTFGDEVTISSMAILASFKQIKGDEFKRATAAAQDMATVMGTDLNSSIMQIGKALNDPVKGMTALSRTGVQFTDSQKAMVKELQASGDLLGAQSIILAELEGQFGGAAAAARDNFGGGLTAADNALGDLKEEIGFLITKNEFFVEGIKAIEQQFISWTGAINANGDVAREWAKDTALALLDMADTGLVAFDYLLRGIDGIKGAFNAVSAILLGFAGVVLEVGKAAAGLTDFLGITSGAFDEWAISAEAAWGAAGDLANKSIGNFSDMAEGSKKVDVAREALGKLKNEMSSVGTGEFKAANAAISASTKMTYAELMNTANQTTAVHAAGAAQQQQATAKATKAMKASWQGYADKVKAIQDSITGRQRSLTEELRAMGRSGMSDTGAWKDQKREAQEYEQAAKLAAKAGNFDEAVAMADKAKAAYKALNVEVKDGDNVVISGSDALKTAMQGVESAGQLAIDILKQQEDQAEKAADALNSENDWQLGEAFTRAGQEAQKLGDKSGEVGKQWSGVFSSMEQDASSRIKKINEALNLMTTKDRTITLLIKEIQARATGGPIHKFATGGKLPGFGGGDRIPALLEAGEFIIRKEAVQRYGSGIFHALNSLTSSMPKFATGGAVGGDAGETVNINFTLPGSTRAYPLRGSRGVTQQLLSDVARMQRLASS